jgi:U-box domain
MAAVTDNNFSQQDTVVTPTAFVCPLTLEVMRDPVVSRYGQSYERSAILQWLAAGNTTCPMTRQPMRMSDLISNQLLRLKIRRWQLENDFDINLVMELPNEDDAGRFFGYFTLEKPEHDDEAERSQDDPDVIRESIPAASSSRRQTHRGAASSPSRPQQRVRRSGFLGRLLPRRAVAA